MLHNALCFFCDYKGLNMTLDISAFAKALESLEEVLRLPLDPIIRDSTIQRFEYTYELAHKMLKRFLKMNAANPHDIDALSFKELVRLAAVNGLINNPEDWFVYRKARNDTSHGYDENKAVLVYNQIQPFAQSATSLLIELKKRINQV